MHTVDTERKERNLFIHIPGRTEKSETFGFLKSGIQKVPDLISRFLQLFVIIDHSCQFQSRLQRSHSCKVLRTGFEFQRQRSISGSGELHCAYHLSPTHERWHLIQNFLLSIKHSRTRGCINLMTGKYIKIATDTLHIDFRMHYTLCSVHEHFHSFRMAYFHYLLYRIHKSEYIRNMGYSQKSCFRCDETFQFIQLQMS